MEKERKDDVLNHPLYQILANMEIGDICRSDVDRPIDNSKYPLWSDGDTIDAFSTTTAAWEIFEPVNG